VSYGCLKITRCSEDNIRIGKQGSTQDNGDTCLIKMEGQVEISREKVP
jgi:hypothetical protein